MIIGTKYLVTTTEYTYVGTLTKQFTGMIDEYSFTEFCTIKVPKEFFELSDVSMIQNVSKRTTRCVAIIIPKNLIIKIREES